MRLMRRRVILAKAESTYGVDPVPAAENGVDVKMSSEVQVSGDKKERDVVRDSLSPLGHVIGSKVYNMPMEFEGRGGGIDGTLQAPEYESFLLACGLQKTETVAVPVDIATGFTVGETITGGTSSATGTLYRTKTGWLILTSVTGTFEEGETLTGGTSSNTATSYGILELADGLDFEVAEVVTGGTSAKTATVVRVETNILIVSSVSGAFTSGETVTGGTSGASSSLMRADQGQLEQIEYRPVSDPASMGSNTVYFYEDGVLHKAVGCRGKLGINLAVGEIPAIRADMTGLYAAPLDQSMPSPETLDLVPPVCHSLGLTIGGYAAVTTALSLDMNTTVTQRKDSNASDGVKELVITNRRPSGSVNPEAPALSEFNPYTAWCGLNGAPTPAAIVCMVGNVPGNRLAMEIPKALYEEVRSAEREGIKAYDLPFVCRIDDTTGSGDDEFRLIYS